MTKLIPGKLYISLIDLGVPIERSGPLNKNDIIMFLYSKKGTFTYWDSYYFCFGSKILEVHDDLTSLTEVLKELT